jgi:hypothetical protein
MTERLYIRILRPFEERSHEVVGFPPSPRPLASDPWEWRGIKGRGDMLVLSQGDRTPKPPPVVKVRTEDNRCLLVSTEPFAVRPRKDFRWQFATGHVSTKSPFLYSSVPVRIEELGRSLSVEEIRRLEGRIPAELHAELLAAKLRGT